MGSMINLDLDDDDGVGEDADDAVDEGADEDLDGAEDGAIDDDGDEAVDESDGVYGLGAVSEVLDMAILVLRRHLHDLAHAHDDVHVDVDDGDELDVLARLVLHDAARVNEVTDEQQRDEGEGAHGGLHDDGSDKRGYRSIGRAYKITS